MVFDLVEKRLWAMKCKCVYRASLLSEAILWFQSL